MTCAGIRTPTASYGSRKPISIFHTKHLELGFLFLIAICTVVNGQLFRRPATTASTRSPAMQEYRQKWVEFLRQRTTVAPLTPHYSYPPRVRVSTGAGNKLVINGFPCERTYDLFPSKNNPRMYHLCARSRDNWYVYHYFCPQGSIFNDGQKRCIQNRTDIATPNIRTTTARTRRPSSSSTSAVPLTSSTTRATTIRIPSTTTATTEAPIPEPATEALVLSSEEFSTEEEMMGTRDVIVHDYTMAIGSDEIEEVTKENDESSDESNMIPESDNETSRVQIAASSPPPPEVRLKEMKKKATMSPLKKKKSKEVADASGGRRPRIFQ